MIKANHKNWAEIVFKPYISRLLKKSFASIEIIGNVPDIQKEMPIILAPNHSTWWDGFFVYVINNIFYQRKFFIMILEEQLAKYKFFSKLGGYSIDQKSPKKIVESLFYTNQIIQKYDNPLVTIFPQGVLEPQFVEKYNFGRGIDRIVNKISKDIAILPLCIRTEFYKEQYPHVFVKFAEPIIVDKGSAFSIKNYEKVMLDLYNSIGKSIINNEDRIILQKGKTSVSDRSKEAFKRINLKD